MDEIGLFPLGIVLLPGERVPLHIFEERYKELIGECLDRDREFGLVFADKTGTRSFGTRAAVVRVLERFPDGRLNIVVEGRNRFHIVEKTEGRSFITARVDDYADEAPAAGGEDEEHVLTAYRRLVEALGAELEEPDSPDRGLAFEIATRIEFGNEIKQELLEARSEEQRLKRLASLLDDAVKLVERRQEIEERAAGNGRVHDL
jgi:Lon protease-like protein